MVRFTHPTSARPPCVVGPEHDRKRLQAEIKATEIEYKKKVKGIEGLLF